jgi:hypothetical protein
MKKLHFCIIILFIATVGYSQIPDFINYQAVLRDASGASLAPGTNGTITFKLYDNLSTATVSYEEVHNFTVSNSGIVNLKIGQGTPVGSNTFPSNVNWFGGEVCYEVYLNGNMIGTRQAFASVPYAIYAKRSEGDLPQGIVNQTLYWDNTLNKWRPTSNLSNNGSNVNIGPTLNGPGNKLHVSTLNSSDTSAILAVKLNAGGRDAGIRSYVIGSTNSSTLDLNQTLIGTAGTASNTGNGPSMGLLGVGYSSGHAFGLTGLAGATSNTAFAIGVYGGFINSSSVSANSWAGYMDGNLFVKDSLFLGGVTNPGNTGDVLMRSSTGRARWQTLNSSNPINMFSSGISNVSPAGPSTSFTINTPAPVFSNTGIGTITGTYPNFFLNVPSPSLTVSGNSITLSQGTVAVTQTVASLFGNGTPGYLPTYSGASTMSISNIFRNATNNRIGFNTTAPATMLHLVKSLGADTLLLESQSVTSGMGIGLKQLNSRYNISLNSGRLIVDQNNVERMVFSNGNVGFGITSPIVPVEVSNTNSVGIRYNGSNTNGAFMQVNSTIAAAPSGYAYLQNGNLRASHFTSSLGDWLLNVNNVNRITVLGSNGNIGMGVGAPASRLHLNGQITINDGVEADGKFLVSNAAGTGQWRHSPATIYFGNLNANSTNVTSTITTLVTGVLSFTKFYPGSEVVIDFNSRIFNGSFGGGASFIIYEVRVDGNTSVLSNAFYSSNGGITEFVNIHAVFQSLTPGPHTITITAYTNTGSSSGVVVDPGGFGGRVTVKEQL